MNDFTAIVKFYKEYLSLTNRLLNMYSKYFYFVLKLKKLASIIIPKRVSLLKANVSELNLNGESTKYSAIV